MPQMTKSHQQLRWTLCIGPLGLSATIPSFREVENWKRCSQSLLQVSVLHAARCTSERFQRQEGGGNPLPASLAAFHLAGSPANRRLFYSCIPEATLQLPACSQEAVTHGQQWLGLPDFWATRLQTCSWIYQQQPLQSWELSMGQLRIFLGAIPKNPA